MEFHFESLAKSSTSDIERSSSLENLHFLFEPYQEVSKSFLTYWPRNFTALNFPPLQIQLWQPKISETWKSLDDQHFRNLTTSSRTMCRIIETKYKICAHIKIEFQHCEIHHRSLHIDPMVWETSQYLHRDTGEYTKSLLQGSIRVLMEYFHILVVSK